MTQLLRVQNFMVSSDGFGAGEGQSLERPFGHADPAELAAWAGATASWPNRTDPGGTRGLDDYFTRDFAHNIGAEIMGRNKFGPQRGPWEDHDWQGWWGDEPAVPHARCSSSPTTCDRRSRSSDTTFHFIDADARRGAAAGEGGGRRQGRAPRRRRRDRPRVPRRRPRRHDARRRRARSSSAAANGSGTSPDELLDRFHLERVPSPSGVTHLLFWRR